MRKEKHTRTCCPLSFMCLTLHILGCNTVMTVLCPLPQVRILHGKTKSPATPFLSDCFGRPSRSRQVERCVSQPPAVRTPVQLRAIGVEGPHSAGVISAARHLILAIHVWLGCEGGQLAAFTQPATCGSVFPAGTPKQPLDHMYLHDGPSQKQRETAREIVGTAPDSDCLGAAEFLISLSPIRLDRAHGCLSFPHQEEVLLVVSSPASRPLHPLSQTSRALARDFPQPGWREWAKAAKQKVCPRLSRRLSTATLSPPGAGGWPVPRAQAGWRPAT
ncbi:hypothetical protein MAPG_06430 [Magnaporthiopsis poae ATCC 64411]|uniref:Uncharacterized protein n=1 Tax=Magnaporthiopsis poae (strain ATCC 64411 / 73-15) TaxID=644358 RepID=A0A0C4E204_MAGP6|nr:hypothetical protein MAPG_06430 [Magnaporthiopsis poae ATCC 64411]